MRILVTRPREEASRLVEGLKSLGAEAVELPLIEIVPPLDWSLLDSALQRLGDFHWAIFTSANGVRFFFGRLEVLSLRDRFPPSLHWGAIGPATARALAENDIGVDFVPTRYIAEAIVEEIGEIQGQRILLPRAEGARPVLPAGLRAKGAEVEEVVAYRTLSVAGITSLAQMFTEHKIDMITLASPSAVRSLVEGLGGTPLNALEGLSVACIGPVTAQVAEELGIKVAIVSKEHTVDGLLKTLVHFFQNELEVNGDGRDKGTSTA